MAKVKSSSVTEPIAQATAIHSLSVEGFKSVGEERTVEVRPLTILAGANSAGKSSAIQPLLLLKQTLEAPYDPGPLLLNGPNVKFTSAAQFVSSARKAGSGGSSFSFGVGLRSAVCRMDFNKGTTQPVELNSLQITRGNREPRTYAAGVIRLVETEWGNSFPNEMFHGNKADVELNVQRDRCFLTASLDLSQTRFEAALPLPLTPPGLEAAILNVIHVPGLRGNPQRNYRVTAVGERFPGTFEDYVASVVATWEHEKKYLLEQLGTDLRALCLTWKVQAKTVDDTQVELRVGRLPASARGGAHDLVSIADVGFGVSQTLPVVVALLAAKPNQLVYVEQPEIHLHPRAQVAMAALLARAAIRGVRVVIETHSSLLLLGVQQLVANGELDPALVKLHWFQRDKQTGTTNINSADLDDAGAFGSWPEDFDDVTLEAQKQYLDAAEKKLAR